MKSSSRTSGGLRKRNRAIGLQGALHRALTSLDRRLLRHRAPAAPRQQPRQELGRRLVSEHLRDHARGVLEDRRELALVVGLRHRVHTRADGVEAAGVAGISLPVQELLLVDESLEVEEADAALLFLDDLARFRRRPGEAPHVAERDALGAKAPPGAHEVVHRLLQRHLELVVPRDAVGILLGPIAVGVHVVPHEVADEREVLADPADVLVQMVAVVDVDDGVDVGGDSHLGNVLETADEQVPRSAILRDEVVDFAPVAVERDVDVGQAGVDAALEEVLLGQLLAVGDHATEELLLARVRERREEQLGDARLPAGEDHAVVAHLDEPIDVAAQLGLVEMYAGRRVTAELALLVAVPRELEVAEVRHPRSSPLDRGARPRGLLAGAFTQLARALRELDQRLDGGRLGRGEPGQARPDGLQRLAVADARRRGRPQGEQLRRRVLRPRAFAERLQLREPLITDEIDVRSLAALVHAAIAAAERLGQVPVYDVRARQLADGDATRLRVEELPVEDLGRLDELRAWGETRGQTARPDGERELGEEALEIAHVVGNRVLQELVARLVQADDIEVRPHTLSLRQEPGSGALIQLDLDLDAWRQWRPAQHDVELRGIAETEQEPVRHARPNEQSGCARRADIDADARLDSEALQVR